LYTLPPYRLGERLAVGIRAETIWLGIDLISKQALQHAAGMCRKSIAGGIADVKGCGRQDVAESRNFLSTDEGSAWAEARTCAITGAV
jgi:hypothetical protein